MNNFGLKLKIITKETPTVISNLFLQPYIAFIKGETESGNERRNGGIKE